MKIRFFNKKKFLLVSMVFFQINAFGKIIKADLLRCLGNEEYLIHKKKLEGPVCELNKRLVNELSMGTELALKDKYFKKICHNKTFSPSVALLKHILLDGKELFNFSGEDSDAIAKALWASSVEGILEKTPEIFFNYLSHIQLQTPSAHCLTNAIPEIKEYQDKFKYLEGEVTIAQILDDRDKVTQIFDKLKQLDSIVIQCEKEIKEKARKEKLKELKQ